LLEDGWSDESAVKLDYGHPQRLRSPLDVEFANINLIFAKDIAMANSMIK